VTPAEARRQAEEILRSPDFRERDTPRPLRGALTWIGERLEPVGRPFRAVLDWIEQDPLAAVIAALVVVALSVLAGVLLARRRGFVLEPGEVGVGGHGRRESPAQLERRADEAERAGDHELALRLRFLAGLLRLDAAGALTFRPSLTTGAVTRAVRSPALAELAATVDEVVYGRRPATPDDVEAARRGWPEALAEASTR
jgi:hypothetical protein